MNDSQLQKVEDFIHDVQSLNPDFAEIIHRVREIFLDHNSSLQQGIKYGGLVFSLNGDLLGGIFAYKKHLSIEFSNGASFTDPSSILEGKGNNRRHLKLSTMSDIDTKNASFFIKQAVQ